MKILVIAYHHGGSTAEGLVTAKLTAALAEHGHTVEVVAADHGRTSPGEAPADDSRAVVHRVADDVDAGVPSWRRALDRGARRGGAVGRLWHGLAAAVNVLDGVGAAERAWIGAAAALARRVDRARGPFDVVHSRLNPVESHLAAMAVVGHRGRRRRPWCAYWSDPWPHHRYPPPYRFTVGWASRRRGDGILHAIMHRADSLVFPAERLRDHLLAGRLAPAKAKAFVIPHMGSGAEKEAERHDGDTLLLRHTGFLMKERRVEPLYEALERFLARRPEARGRLRLEFAGRYPAGIVPEAPAALRETVAFRPWMPAREAARWIGGADVAVLVEAALAEGIFFPSKLADYLVARKPILALSPRVGVAADRLADGGGVLAPPDDPAAVSEAIDELWRRFSAGRLAELAPSAAAAAAVSAEAVVPRYLEAFHHAGARVGR